MQALIKIENILHYRTLPDKTISGAMWTIFTNPEMCTGKIKLIQLEEEPSKNG